MEEVLLTKPDDPISFMIDLLSKKDEHSESPIVSLFYLNLLNIHCTTMDKNL